MSIKEKICLQGLEQLSPKAYKLTFLAPEIAARAKPGQFLMLESPVYLKRPYGIMSTDPETGCLELGIDPVGRGSSWHTRLELGAQLTALGPLGRGFVYPEPGKRLVLLGGGSGVYPLLAAAEAAGDYDLTVILGFRQAEFAVLEERFKQTGANLILCSDQGGLDYKGNTVGALIEFLGAEPCDNIEIWACGPIPMLSACAKLAESRGLACQLSFEARMACGVGFCSGCTIPIKGSQPQRCCYDGPVFRAEQIDWEVLNGK